MADTPPDDDAAHPVCSASSWCRRAAAALLAVVVLLLAPGVANAHGGIIPQPIIETQPELAGFDAMAVVTVAPQLVVRNTSETPVTFLDDDGRPWLRVSAAGVEADLSLRRWWEANDPSGVGQDPPPDAPEGWTLVSEEFSFGWFPRSMRPRSRPDEGHAWSIPVVVGDDRRGEVAGTLQEQELQGRWLSTLDGDGSAGGAQLAVVSGTVPAMVLQRGAAAEVVVLGAQDEPMLRLDATGVVANLVSPTWQQHARWDTASARPEVPADADAPPAWEPVAGASGTATWLDPRAATGQVRPLTATAAGRELAFEVPLVVDGERVVVAGTTRWEGEVPPSGPPGWLVPAVAVAVALLLVGGHRLRATRATGE